MYLSHLLSIALNFHSDPGLPSMRVNGSADALVVVIDRSNKSGGNLSETTKKALYTEVTSTRYAGVIGDYLSEWRDSGSSRRRHIVIVTSDQMSQTSQLATIELKPLTASMSRNTKLVQVVEARKQVIRALKEPVRAYSGTHLLKAISRGLSVPQISRPARVVLVSNLFEQDADLGVDFGNVLSTPAIFTERIHTRFVNELDSAFSTIKLPLKNDSFELFITSRDSTQGKYSLALAEIWKRALIKNGAMSVTAGTSAADLGWSTASK